MAKPKAKAVKKEEPKKVVETGAEAPLIHFSKIEGLKDTDIEAQVKRHGELSALIASFKEEKDEIAEVLKSYLDAFEVETVGVLNARVTRVADGFQEKLSREKLLKLGVKATIIAQAIEKTPKKGFVKVTFAKPAEE